MTPEQEANLASIVKLKQDLVAICDEAIGRAITDPEGYAQDLFRVRSWYFGPARIIGDGLDWLARRLKYGKS